jgi:diguanylate cyclase (GGDEF)-like protein
VESAGAWRAVVDAIGYGICVLDARGVVVAANPEGVRLLGGDPTGRKLWDVVRVVEAPSDDTPNRVISPLGVHDVTETLRSGQSWRRDDALFIVRAGRAFPGHAVLTPVALPDGTSAAVLAFHDDSGRREFVEELEHLAAHDTLTGLPNRLLLFDRLHQAVARAGRSRALLAVLFCDLDGFKAVNDDHGHEVGDRLLVETAVRLRQSVRPADTVARFGGDEFVVLCEELADADAAQVLAARILRALERPFLVGADGGPVSVSSSIGIALSAGGHGPEELLRVADAAMYRAKVGGRGRVEVTLTTS